MHPTIIALAGAFSASGLLLVCVGRATRLAEYLTGLPKTYLATMRLGEASEDDTTSPV